MTGWSTSALLLAAAVAGAAAQPAPVLLGAVISQSGPHAEAGGDYRKGLLLWQDEINAAGGLVGRRVELRIEDDGSEAARARRAYEQLLDMGAEVLVGPYGSAAALAATAEAERARRVMLNAAGASSLVHRRSPRYVFQVVAPYASYARGVLSVAQAAGVRSLFIVARDDAASREMAEAAQASARELGFARVELELYSGTVVDFLPQVYKAMAVEADGWIAFGEVRDAADMVKTLKRQGYVPRLFYARASPDPRFIELVGQDAESILGSKPYDARFPTSGNAAFVQAFAARWSGPPGAQAAAAYAAGQVLAAAARRAGTLDAEKLRSALAALEVETVLGTYRADPQNGAQLGIAPPLTQIVRGRTEALWPAALAGDRALAPFVSWTERQVLK